MAMMILIFLAIVPGCVLCFVRDVGLLCGVPLVLLGLFAPVPMAAIGFFVLLYLALFIAGTILNSIGC